jgi:hypothetical protein
MRTTITLDDDVAVMIERLHRRRGGSFKSVVNDALREGLKHLGKPAQRQAPFRTASFDAGRCLIGSLDNVAEVVAIAEGDDFR